MNNFSLILLIGLIFYFGINYDQFKKYSTDINDNLKELEGKDYYKLLYLFSTMAFLLCTALFLNMMFSRKMDVHETHMIIGITILFSILHIVMICLVMKYVEKKWDLYQLYNLLYTLIILVSVVYTIFFDIEHLHAKK
jgi:hypothetical protein